MTREEATECMAEVEKILRTWPQSNKDALAATITRILWAIDGRPRWLAKIALVIVSAELAGIHGKPDDIIDLNPRQLRDMIRAIPERNE